MKKLISALLISALILSLALSAVAEDKAEVTTTGFSTVVLQADTATIEIGARTLAKTVAQAQKENSAIMDGVIQKLTEIGLSKEDIRTTNFYIGFEPDYSYPSSEQQYEAGNFAVNNTVSVTVRDLEKLSLVIDTAAAAGANNVYNLVFSSSKAKEAYREALKLAVEDATEKAKALAQASGRELGTILAMNTSEGYQNYGVENLVVHAEEDAKGIPMLPGGTSLTAYVSITFELK